jgi:23S rRNA (cytosine1962-C5)-methyltransferase
MERPTVRLRPKANAQRIRHGFPWVYSDEVVLDRRTKALTPGTVVRLEDGERRALGTAALNPGSRIALRMLDRDPDAVIDGAWLEARMSAAWAHRERVGLAPWCRVVHAEADGLPGVVVDAFGEAAVIQPNAAWAEALLAPLAEAVRAVTGASAVVKNAGGRARALEGLDDVSSVLLGAVDGPVLVPMNGAVYAADLLGGQKTGLFYDQRPNHAFAARLARGAVLDVFSHVGGFGLAMLAGGAERALCVDSSAPALALARRGAAEMGLADRLETRRADAFEALAALGAEGARFEVVVCDPPAFAPAKPAREAGLRAYERLARLAAPLAAPGGYLVLCSCSHAVDLAAFREASVRGVGRAGRASQIVHTGFAGPDHPVHPLLPETGYLKALVLRLP